MKKSKSHCHFYIFKGLLHEVYHERWNKRTSKIIDLVDYPDINPLTELDLMLLEKGIQPSKN